MNTFFQKFANGLAFGLWSSVMVLAISLAYAATTYYSDLPTASSWATMRSADWNALVDYANKAVKQDTEVLTVTGGKVGIGTASPNKNLHLYNVSTNAEIDLQSTATAWTHWGMYHNAADQSLRFWHVGANDAVTVMPDGKVWIGTVNPNAKLTVSQTAANAINVSADAHYGLFSGAANGGGDRLSITAWPAGVGANIYAYNNASTDYSPLNVFASTYIFKIGASERVRIDASGNVGIGTIPSSWNPTHSTALQLPSGALHSYDTSQLVLMQNAYYSGLPGSNYKTSAAAAQYAQAAGGHYWYTAPAGTVGNSITWNTAMNIDNNGNVGIGTTTTNDVKLGLNTDASGNTWGLYITSGSNGSTYPLAIGGSTLDFYIQKGGASGYLRAASWTYGSDRRLKENIAPLQYGLKETLQLKPSKFDYITGSKNQFGFIAQDVQTVLPELVSTTENGMLGLKTDGMIPVLVNAIQEQQREIEALKERMEILENKQ